MVALLPTVTHTLGCYLEVVGVFPTMVHKSADHVPAEVYWCPRLLLPVLPAREWSGPISLCVTPKCHISVNISNRRHALTGVYGQLGNRVGSTILPVLLYNRAHTNSNMWESGKIYFFVFTFVLINQLASIDLEQNPFRTQRGRPFLRALTRIVMYLRAE
jgi:hypothetical protein